MKKIIFVLALSSLTLSAQTRTLTLEESIKTGLENSKLLKVSSSKVAGAGAKITEASSQMLPKLSLGAGYTRLSGVSPFEVSLPISPLPVKIQDAILNNYTLRLSLQQAVFTGFRLSSLKSAAEYNMEAAEQDYGRDANETALNIQNAFWNLYKIQKVLALVEENIKRLENHVADTKTFLDNGLVTKNDYLKLEVQLASARLMRIESSNGVKIARASFNKLLGYGLSDETEISAPEINIGVEAVEYDALSKEALNNRAELKSTQLRVRAGQEALTAAKSSWFPTVYAFGDLYYNRPNQRILPNKDEFNETWDLGIMLNWDLWNWGYSSSQSAQAEQVLIQTETALEQIKDNIELEVYKAYLRLLSEFDKLEVNKVTVEQAEENYRIISEKYGQQLATSTELIDAEVSLLDAKTKLSTALVDFQIANVVLKKSVGRKLY